jgi:hypothetical protein
VERIHVIRTFTLAIVVSAVIGAPATAAASAGLVGYWNFDEGQGTLAADSSGFGNNATLEGNAAWVPGHSGFALSFDGSGLGRVQVPDSSSLEPSSGVTVESWIKSAGSPGVYRYIVAKGAAGCITASYGLYTGLSGGLEFYVSTGHGTAYRDSPDAGDTIWDGRWHFVVGTYDGAAVRLYVDGKQVGSGTPWTQPIGYTLSASNDLFIGDYPGCRNIDWGFRGTIDEVSVWSRALSAAEIAAAASSPQSTVSPSPTGALPAPGTVSPNPGTSGGTPQTPPQLMFLNLVPAMFRLGPGSRGTGTTISYTATERETSTVTVLRAVRGVLKLGRCVKPAVVRGARPRGCTRFVAVGSFRHSDKPGRNRFHFSGLPGRNLTSGQYRLTVTPQAHGERGRMIDATFWILR